TSSASTVAGLMVTPATLGCAGGGVTTIPPPPPPPQLDRLSASVAATRLANPNRTENGSSTMVTSTGKNPARLHPPIRRVPSVLSFLASQRASVKRDPASVRRA